MKDISINRDKYDFKDKQRVIFRSPRGLNEKVVREISQRHNEPVWMLSLRLKAFKYFQELSFPAWGADLSEVDFDNIFTM